MDTVQLASDAGLSSRVRLFVERDESERPGKSEAKKPSLLWRVKNWVRQAVTGEHLIPVWQWLGPKLGFAVIVGEWRAVVVHADGTVTDYGRLGRHLVTTAGKNFVAGCFNNTNEPEVMKYMGFGTGTTAASTSDTALQTELTTQYASSNTRPTGTQSVSTNTYSVVATLAPTTSVAITETGIFSQASNAGGTLLDRQVFSAVNLTSSDTLTPTFTLTIS